MSYEELLADPVRVVRDLHDALKRFGVEGLTLPSEQHIRQIVNPDFNRSGTNRDNTLLDPDQRTLLDGLRTRSVLHERVAPSSDRTFEVLAVLGEMEQLEESLRSTRERVTILDQLLGEVFASRSWRIGSAVTGLLRILRRGRAVSAEERWRELT